MKDTEIIELYWNRDETAIAATADTYSSYCYCIAYNILNNKEDAEECVNDTWHNAWRSIPPHRPERLSTYLGKLTRNLSLNRYKLLNAQQDVEQVLDGMCPAVPNTEFGLSRKVPATSRATKYTPFCTPLPTPNPR